MSLSKEIRSLEELVGVFDFLLQEGVVMTKTEHKKLDFLLSSLTAIVDDFEVD